VGEDRLYLFNTLNQLVAKEKEPLNKKSSFYYFGLMNISLANYRSFNLGLGCMGEIFFGGNCVG
jgi:hypothetical protein